MAVNLDKKGNQIANCVKFDFMTCSIEDLKNVDMNFKDRMVRKGNVNGYAFWFTANFDGTD